MSKKAKRILALLDDRRLKNRLLESFNKGTLDEGSALVGKGDQEMKVLKEMNELQEFQDDVWSKDAL